MYNIIKYGKYILESDNCIIVDCYKIMYDYCEILGLKNWVYFVKIFIGIVYFKSGIDSL